MTKKQQLIRLIVSRLIGECPATIERTSYVVETLTMILQEELKETS